MATNKMLEQVAVRVYKYSMKHLQQLIMDAEKCSKTFGKKSLFGTDKFAMACEKFNQTMGECAVALVEDGQLESYEDMDLSMIEINKALGALELAYGSWPVAFDFWRNWYSNYSESVSIKNENISTNYNDALSEFFGPKLNMQRMQEITDATYQILNSTVYEVDFQKIALATKAKIISGASRHNAIIMIKNSYPQLSSNQAAQIFDRLRPL